MKHITALTTLLCFASLVWAGPVHAQKSAVDLKLTPSSEFVHVRPGSTYEHTVTLTHTGSVPLVVTPTFVEFSADNISGQPLLIPDSDPGFVEITSPTLEEDGTFILKPNSARQIVIALKPSQETAPREYPITVLFATQPTTDVQGRGSASKTQATIGANIVALVNNQGAEPTGIQVADIQTTTITDSFRPLEFRVMFENISASASPISGYALVKDWRGSELHRFQFAEQMILGKSTRLAELKPDDNEEITTGTTTFVHDAPFLLGPVTIEVHVTDPRDTDIITYTARSLVIALPISILIAIVFGLITYLGYLFWSNKKHHLAKY